MPKRNPAADEAADLRGAMSAIGRVISDGRATPKGKLQQITGILFMFNVPVSVASQPGDAK